MPLGAKGLDASGGHLGSNLNMGTSKSVSVSLQCPHCREKSQQVLARLITKNRTRCPNCSGVIDLETGDNGLRIQKLAQACQEIDAAISKLRKLK